MAMASVMLSKHDINVLEKIKDPEADPSVALVVDPTLAKDPHVDDPSEYERVVDRERNIVLSIQQLEFQLASLKAKTVASIEDEYKRCVTQLGELIEEFPNYGSARNNRAQAIRRLLGDSMLMTNAGPGSQVVLKSASSDEIMDMAATALSDLDRCVALLSPHSLFAPISPQAAKTLSLAHTQRAAIYYASSKAFDFSTLNVKGGRREAQWGRIDFEEAASRDFAFGGRYGNDIAKGLAVSTNPTAKLCGQMVREAMKKEYGPEYDS